tara:strand:+ start:612 stop:1295 length:684 start_codon:yes stop_codon:yes gene_type:complete
MIKQFRSRLPINIFAAILFSLVSFGLSAQDMDDYAAAYFYKFEPMEAEQLLLHQEQRNISVGLVQLDEDEQEQMLGDEAEDTLVYKVVVTNKSPVRILLLGRDIQAVNSNQQLSSLTLPQIVRAVDPPNASTGRAIADTTLGVLTMGVHTAIRHVAEGDTDRQVRTSYLESTLFEKMLGHKVIEPGGSYQGLVVFDEEEWGNMEPESINLSVQNLAQLAYLDFSLSL